MENKFCRLCQTEKKITEFAWKSTIKRIKQTYCKECQKIRSRIHYKNNRLKYIEKARKRNQEVLKKIQQYVWSYLDKHPCIDCGENDIIVLEFDHEKDKYYNIFELIKERGNLKKVKSEIKKCVVRCANCHRRKTAEDFGWKKTFLPR